MTLYPTLGCRSYQASGPWTGGARGCFYTEVAQIRCGFAQQHERASRRLASGRRTTSSRPFLGVLEPRPVATCAVTCLRHNGRLARQKKSSEVVMEPGATNETRTGEARSYNHVSRGPNSL